MASYDDNSDMKSEGRTEGRMSRGAREDSDEPSKVQHYLEAQALELQRFRETLGMLYDRIAPVLGPERSEKLAGDSDDSPERSEVVRVIIDQTDNLRVMHRRLMESIQRIEL